jgi:hypothetical protein
VAGGWRPNSQDLVNAFDVDSKPGKAPCGHALNAGPINCGQNGLSLIPATYARVEMAFQSSSSYLWLGHLSFGVPADVATLVTPWHEAAREQHDEFMHRCPAANLKGHHRFQVEAQRHKLSSSHNNVFAEALQDQATTWARSTSSEMVASPHSTAVSISTWFPTERNAAGSASGAPIATERSMSLLRGIREHGGASLETQS